MTLITDLTMNAVFEQPLLSDDTRFRPVVELIATSLEHQQFQAAATAVLGKPATSLGCNNAYYSAAQQHLCKIRAVSHSAALNEKMNLNHAACAAMNEALDQDRSIVFPSQPGRPIGVLHAHAEFARQAKAGSVCPLCPCQ